MDIPNNENEINEDQLNKELFNNIDESEPNNLE